MSVWGLPESIVHAVQFHQNPCEMSETRFSTLTAVHCADAIASSFDKSPLNHDVDLDMAYLTETGMLEKSAAWRDVFRASVLMRG